VPRVKRAFGQARRSKKPKKRKGKKRKGKKRKKRGEKIPEIESQSQHNKAEQQQQQQQAPVDSTPDIAMCSSSLP